MTDMKRPRSSALFLISCVVVVCLAGSAAVIHWAAPHAIALIAEGYPRSVWPAPGHHATVGGVAAPAGPHHEEVYPAADPQLAELFGESGGRALLVWHDGRLRYERYAAGYSADTRFNSFSMVKSLVDALVLRAHADGLIESLDDPVGRYLPAFRQNPLGSVPIQQFMTMSSGIGIETSGPAKGTDRRLKPVETGSMNPFEPIARLHAGGLDSIGEKLRINPQWQGKFDYQNVNTAILGRLISSVYGQTLPDILSTRIWRPSGAQDARWRAPAAGKEVSAYCCLYATARDWIRVGLFLAQNGTPDAPFLPAELWQRYLGGDLSAHDRATGRYGLHIYHDVLDRKGQALNGPFSYMLGTGGQITYLMPAENLVVVRFGERHALLHSTLYAAWRTIQNAR